MSLALKSSSKGIFCAFILGYSVGIAVLYMLPIWSGGEWYNFYAYLDGHGVTPYVDVREGYPPLGFLIYMPLYYAIRGNPAAFNYAFRAINGALLIATLLTICLIFKSLFNEKRVLKLVLYYAAAPSVVIANTYSNDVVALLPAVLAIYMMIKRKSAAYGLLIGLATLGKGFPILLLIPAFIAFKDAKDKLKLVACTLITLAIASLPFALINPLTYLSTFIHHNSRGPWETIWALIEGYYSHGGLLHPYFDKFLYHSNLLKVYPANSYDHAIYEWRFNLMPNLLTLAQIATIIALALTYAKRKEKILSLCGLLYVANMLFFKGYSTQFAVSTSLYVILAAVDKPLIFLIPLELSHIMQMLSWNAQVFAPEFLRNEHLLMLVTAIILRSVIFIYLIADTLVNSRFSYKQITDLARRLQIYLKRLFRDRLLVLVVSATLLMVLVSYSALYGYLSGGAGFRILRGNVTLTQLEWQSVKVDELEGSDQVIVRLATGSWLDVELNSSGSPVHIERGIRNPYNFKGSFNETMLFFIANSESFNLKLRMEHPKIPFRITDGLDGDLSINMTSDGSAFLLKLRDEGMDGQGSMFRMAYPCRFFVRDDFRLTLKYRVTEGNVSNVLLDIFDDTDEWLYTFTANQDFILTPSTADLHGYSNLLNDEISLVALVVLLDDGSSATLRLEELSISGGGESHAVNFYAENWETIQYEIFIERDFKPSIGYAVPLILSVAFGSAALYLMCMRKSK